MAILPKISLDRLTSSQHRTVELKALHDISCSHGFFYLIDHGVSQNLIDRAIRASKSFFALPSKTKELYGHENQTVKPLTARGYSPLLSETLHPDSGADPKEVFDLGIETNDDGQPFRGHTNFPPDNVVAGFADSLLSLQDAVVSSVVETLGRSLADILTLDTAWYDQHFSQPTILQRVIFYPSNGGTAGKHTDNGFFTVLLQEQLEVESLLVLLNGKWTPIPSLSEGFVINIGDMFQLMSDGRFKSTPHHVIHPGPVSRISLPFFVYPNIEASLCSRWEHKTFSVKDVMLKNFTSIWETKDGAGRAQELN